MCPHCGRGVTFDQVGTSPSIVLLKSTRGKRARMLIASCPTPQCGRIIISAGEDDDNPSLIWPLTSSRPAVSDAVPAPLRKDYVEAALVLRFSPNASAALSRRCLQATPIANGAPSATQLSVQIKHALQLLPAHVGKNLDALRYLGNFAAHAEEDKAAIVVDVEPEEAEWMLDVLDSLFAFYFVSPAEDAKRIEALRAKQIAAGKKPHP